MTTHAIPDRIQFGPTTYRVTIDELDLLREMRSQRCDLLGFSNHRHTVIGLTTDQSPASMRDTVLHEVVPVLLEQTGIGRELEDDTEERYVTRLTPALLDLLRRNTELLEFLTHDDDADEDADDGDGG